MRKTAGKTAGKTARRTGTRWAAGLLAATALLAAGCTSGSETAADMGAAAPAEAPAAGGPGVGRLPGAAPTGAAGEQDASGGQKAGDQRAGRQGGEQETVAQPGVDRKLVRKAELSVEAPDPVGAAAEARRIAVAAGGYSGSEEVTGEQARLTLHVPSDVFDQVVADLSGQRVGKVVSSSQTATDVTEQLVDVESRITTQRASLERVRALLARAGSVDEVVRIESEVTRREADLESLLKRREALAGQVAVSTITVRVALPQEEVKQVEPERDDSLLGAFATGWDAFTGSMGALLRFVAVVLPFAVLIGLVGYGVWRLRGRWAPVPERTKQAGAAE